MTDTMNDYSKVPWFRKSSNNGALAFVGFFLFPPLLWWACINCLTGKIYYNKKNENGNLKTWSKANTIAAIILLVLQAIGIIYRVAGAGV